MSGVSAVLRALRNPSLRRAIFAYFVFNAAEYGVWIAMLIYAFSRGGTKEAGLVALVQLVPSILVAPAAAVAGDRLRRDRALALGYALQTAAIGLTGLAITMRLPASVVFVCAALEACALTLTPPVHNAALPGMSQTPQELTAANALSGTLGGFAVFVGPVITGVLVATIGIGSVFGVFAALLGLSAALVATARIRDPLEERPSAATFTSAEVFEGLRELRREPTAALLVAMIGAEFVAVGMLDVLAVVLAVDILRMGPSGPGLMAGMAGVGALVGGGAAVALVGRSRLSPAVGIAILAVGVPLAFVGFAGAPIAAALLLIAAGIGKGVFDVGARTLMQRTVPDEVLARVFGLQEGLMMAGLAIGSISVPPLVGLLGDRGAFVAAGAFLPALGLLSWRRLTAIDAGAERPGPELEFLRSISIFRPLAPAVAERLSRAVRSVEVEAGVTIIQQGEAGDRFYVIAEGEVDVTVDGGHVGRYGRGDYVGEIALLRDGPRTATVTATGPVRLLALERDDFLWAVSRTRPGSRIADELARRRLGESEAQG
jgi:MFS family permease